MIKHYLKNQKGATIVASCLLIVSLLGFAGLVADVGNIYIEKGRLQDTADVAALAGAQAAPRGDEVKQMARKYVLDNYKNGDCESPLINWSSKENKLTITLKKKIPTYFIRVFGCNSVPITVYATATCENNSDEYAIYSNKDLEFRCSEVRGKVYSGGKIKYHNQIERVDFINKVIGSIEAVGLIDGSVEIKTLNGNNGEAKSNVKKQGMPKVILPRGASFKSKVTAADLAEGPVFVMAGSTIDLGNTSAGGVIMSDGDITIRVKDLKMLDPSKKIDIRTVGTGTIRLDLRGSGNINARIHAPEGKVVVVCGDSFIINGCIVADEVISNTSPLKVFAPNNAATSSTSSKLFG